MLFQRNYSTPDTRDFSAFQIPMAPIPARVEAAIARGVQPGAMPFSNANRLLEPAGDGMIDGVVRNADGGMVVCCQTDMPGVTPAMWDWWFSWHGYASERYKLWHPKDHLSTVMTEERRGVGDVKSRYVGNTSLVEEYIGPGEVQKLSIAFKPPRDFGLDEAKLASLGTAICARGGARDKFADSAYLIHFVRATPEGAQMNSRFWFGDMRSKIPVVGGLISRKLNSKAMREEIFPDAFGLQLLRHCSEEMGHMARILPGLHAKFGSE